MDCEMASGALEKAARGKMHLGAALSDAAQLLHLDGLRLEPDRPHQERAYRNFGHGSQQDFSVALKLEGETYLLKGRPIKRNDASRFIALLENREAFRRFAEAAEDAFVRAMEQRRSHLLGLLHGVESEGMAFGLTIDAQLRVHSPHQSLAAVWDPKFRIHAGRLWCGDTKSRIRLARHLTDTRNAAEYCMIKRSPERFPVLLRTHRIHAEYASDLWLPGADRVLALYDLDAVRAANPTAIQALFKLTPAETAIACLFSASQNIKEISAATGVTRETTRHHLKSIYQKMDVHTQAELMHRLLHLPRQLG